MNNINKDVVKGHLRNVKENLYGCSLMQLNIHVVRAGVRAGR